ncbi:lipoprotein [Streptomyces sp. NPDC059875]|uniref:lipoprotein n=1 Tax=unclassified Streptomyces TaxID=2593676 RepID=UPI003662B005
MRHPIRIMVPALAALAASGLLTGCLGTEAKPDRTVDKPAAKATSAAPEASRATLGGPGTACALPVSFALAADWKPNAIKNPEDPEFAALTRQGPVLVRCEIDGKPAGHIGYLRIWTGKQGDARATLEAFVKAAKNTSKVTYKETKAGALPATEVTYTVYNDIMEESKEERAFAVSTPKGAVVVHLGGLDSEEHRAMLPAYELARSSLKAL